MSGEPSDHSNVGKQVILLTFASLSIAAFVTVLCMCRCKAFHRNRRHQPRAQANQNSIYNISGRVQGQNQAQFPDAYLSIEHITINNELNKPPKYDDAPPSYEEAIKLAIAQSNSLQTFEAEQAQTSQVAESDAATTSTVSTSTDIVVPAVSSRTTD